MRGGVWPEWGRAARLDIIQGCHVGRHAIMDAQRTLASASATVSQIVASLHVCNASHAELHAIGGQLAAVAEHLDAIKAGVRRADVAVARIELTLRQLEEERQSNWPRHGRRIYVELTGLAVGSHEASRRAIVHIEAAYRLVIEARSVCTRRRALKTAMHLIGEHSSLVQKRLLQIRTVLDEIHVFILSIANTLLSAHQEGDSSEDATVP